MTEQGFCDIIFLPLQIVFLVEITRNKDILNIK